MHLYHPSADVAFPKKPLKKKKKPLPKWYINGFPATILTWTQPEWNRLIDKPLDAQLCDYGVWVALRMD